MCQRTTTSRRCLWTSAGGRSRLPSNDLGQASVVCVALELAVVTVRTRVFFLIFAVHVLRLCTLHLTQQLNRLSPPREFGVDEVTKNAEVLFYGLQVQRFVEQ